MKKPTASHFVTLGALLVVAAATAMASVWFSMPTHRIVANHSSGVLGAQVTRAGISLEALSRIDHAADPTSGLYRSSVTLQLRNNSGDRFEFAPGLQIHGIDSRGQLVPLTTRYIDPTIVLGGPVESGTTSKVTVDFVLATDVRLTQVIFQTDASATQQVVEL